MFHKFKYLLLLFPLLLSACSVIDKLLADKKIPLEGHGVSVVEYFPDSITPDDKLNSLDFKTPPQVENSYIDGRTHNVGNILFNWQNLKLSRKLSIHPSHTLPLSSLPVIAEGKLVILEATGILKAFDLVSGKILWENSFFSKFEKFFFGRHYLSGGILYESRKLFVTAGVDTIGVFDIGDGKLLWQKSFSMPLRCIAAVSQDRVVLQGMQDTLYVLDIQDGTMLWNRVNIGSKVQSLNAITPIVMNDKIVLMQERNDKIVALDLQTGREFWTLGTDSYSAFIKTGNIVADHTPIYDNDMVFMPFDSGSLIAMHARNPQVLWKRYLMTIKASWIAGDLLYTINERNQLLAVYKYNGLIKWVTDLKAYSGNKDKQDVDLYCTPPVVAGDLVLTINSAGQMLGFNLLTGKLELNFKMPKGHYLRPFVHSNMLYVVNNNGTITIYSNKD
ncbi:exported hypothetical protein [Alphaproteobacteria bacterium]